MSHAPVTVVSTVSSLTVFWVRQEPRVGPLSLSSLAPPCPGEVHRAVLGITREQGGNPRVVPGLGAPLHRSTSLGALLPEAPRAVYEEGGRDGLMQYSLQLWDRGVNSGYLSVVGMSPKEPVPMPDLREYSWSMVRPCNGSTLRSCFAVKSSTRSSGSLSSH
jgi:hypothetical protein